MTGWTVCAYCNEQCSLPTLSGQSETYVVGATPIWETSRAFVNNLHVDGLGLQWKGHLDRSCGCPQAGGSFSDNVLSEHGLNKVDLGYSVLCTGRIGAVWAG